MSNQETPHNYCLKCGSKLKEKEENCYRCPSCGFQYYISPKPTCGAIIINKKGQVLLCKRGTEPQKDKWDTVGGFVDINETLEEAMIREIKEELSVTVTDYVYFRSYYDRYYFAKDNYYTLGMVFIVRITGDEPIQPADDASEVKWFDVNDLPFEEAGFPSIKQVLHDYQAYISQ